MKLNFIRISFISLILLSLTSCSNPVIGITTNFQEANFKVGKTTKAEIINHLGLPQNVQKDKNGQQHLIYTDKVNDLGVCTYCENPGQTGSIPTMKDNVAENGGAEYVINSKGILIAKFESKPSK